MNKIIYKIKWKICSLMNKIKIKMNNIQNKIKIMKIYNKIWLKITEI